MLTEKKQGITWNKEKIMSIEFFSYFLQTLTVVFIVLKLTGVISWSWLLVLSPLLVPFGAIYVIWLISFIVVALFGEN